MDVSQVREMFLGEGQLRSDSIGPAVGFPFARNAVTEKESQV